jgi:polysaccharide deacetylase family protein (PEP-CTERM system associated)
VAIHHFTVDVEEYFHVSAFEPYVERRRWERFESRVDHSVDRLLDLLAEHGARGTFFVLGWLAERRPALVRRIAAAGHEIASHGADHRRVTHQTPDEVRASVRRSKHVLEDITGVPVRGFRAPSFSIVPGREWALDVLLEEGYVYDSSLFPVRRRGYGYPGGERDPHWIERPGGRLGQVPPATLRLAGVNLPASGGAYFRLFPYPIIQAAFRQAEARGVPGTFYLHPWELDPEQPRLAVPWWTRVRHYGGIRHAEERLHRLLSDFRFQPIADTLALSPAAVPPQRVPATQP